MTWIELIVFALATWRVSSFLANEAGPGDAFERVRLLAGMRYDEHSERRATNVVSSEIMCQWCNSVWVGLGWMLFYLGAPRVAFYCALPFALSTGTILIMTSKGIQVFLRHLKGGH